jgi:molecular chaperone Hsp33
VSDYLVRTMAREAGMRGFACITTGLGLEGARRHDASPLSTAVLSEGLTAAALLGTLLKVRQRVALKIEGNGPARKMVTESDANGHVRGYIAEAHLPSPIDIGPEQMAFAIGNEGRVTVAKDVGLKDLFHGIVPLHSGDVDRELNYYLNRSEQIPSFVEIGAKVNSIGELTMAGGLLLQAMPGADETVLKSLSERAQEMPPLINMLDEGERPEDVLNDIFAGLDLEILEQRPLDFRCSCSWQRSKKALMMIGAQEVRSLMEEGEAVIECHFCHERYMYGVEALETVLDEILDDV